jgi:lipid II:glycine glycyltransferase (peptidoglycan interpeptide bridge formation enzyme)
MGQFGLFCIGGPLGVESQKMLDLFLKKCEEICQTEKCLFAQIEPLEKMESSWKTGAYKKFIEPTTTRIDLTFSEEELLAKMKPKGRYNIKVAEKNNVSVEWKKCTPENIKTFYSLLTETTKRDGFATNSLDYFTHLGNYIEKNNLGGILFASRENEILAAGIFIYYEKTALYYYGASVSEAEKRKYMASYLLQWEAIRE